MKRASALARPRSAVVAAIAASVVAGAACKGAPAGSHGPASNTESACAPTGNQNADVMNALAGECAGCHGEGTNKPYFASLAAFEGTLVYDTKYVVPGHPEQSELLRLLEGQGQGMYTQMPTSGPTFAASAAQGKTSITIAALEDWIRNLPPQGAASFDYLKAATVRRLSAAQVLASLDAPLGLDESDFYYERGTELELTDGDQGLPARSPDALDYRDDDAFNASQSYPRWLGLGGAAWQAGKPGDTSLSATFLETLTQMSQARCRKAVTKRGNTAFFRYATLSDASDRAPQRIRKNIGYLHLRLLGEPATEADVSDLYESVFLPYEPKGAETAWTAVCAALVRHPKWVSY